MCDHDEEMIPVAGASVPGRAPAMTVSASPPGPGQAPGETGGPRSPGEALDLVLAGLGWLASADLASVPVAVQAECLRVLERAASVHTAARARALSAFDAAAGYEDDGVGSSRSWLRWQTRVTTASASASVRWMRRLRSHQHVAAALAAGTVSMSWAREICGWTDQLPEDARDDADQILLAAAAGGAALPDLARLAEEMRRRLAGPDDDGDDGFEDRYLRLQATLGGAGRLDGDLTPRCAEAVQAVLDALGKKAGPEDTRTQRQRHHDALEEMCRRLIAAGGLPDRAGQPTQIQLHMTLEELARLHQDTAPGSAQAGDGQPEDGTGHPQAQPVTGTGDARSVRSDHEYFGPAATAGDACDATIVPIVTGRVDQDLLDQLTAKLASTTTGGGQAPDRGSIGDLILANAVALLSGPGQLASLLRTGHLGGPAATVSLPLDLGTASDTIPAHLRRAVILRDRHCSAPGCFTPAAACHVHHITPRSKGGRTRLKDLILACPFHHLIVIHTWGWTIALNADGTTTMTSPDGSRIYHSHSPPTFTAA
ncbi:MAG TPA: DUF222 domain-containing protein [Streptosporangiaceae bacterium]|nr:DUF222 domain-containing protein [Streptosporangiaceae bacterium]